MIKIGMPTLVETRTLAACAELCAGLGLDFVELNMNLPQYQLPEIDAGHLAGIADTYGIFYTIHLDENLNVSDFNPYIAEGYRRTVAETIELAKALGIPVLNMHLSRGVYFTLPEGRIYLFSEYRERYLKSVADFRKLCEDSIGDSDVTVCVENCAAYTDFQREALAILLGSPVFGLTFDIGHDHGCGGANEGFIVENRSRLRHMHVHDALGQRDHLALGTGEIDVEKYLTMAQEQNCRVVLETKTVAGLRQSVEWLRSRWKTGEREEGRSYDGGAV